MAYKSEDTNVTSDDKDTIENIVSDLSGYLRPILENDQIEDIFDNKTLDTFTKKFILMLNEIKTEGNITKYIDQAGNLELETSLVPA
jgi:hypothetical protein